NLKPLNWKLVGIDQNRWRIKLFSLPKNSFNAIGEGLVSNSSTNLQASKNPINSRKKNYKFLQLPDIKRNKFYVVIDPGHGGADPGAIGIGGLRESEVVLDVSKQVKRLLSSKGVKVKLTRNNELDLDLAPRVSIANKTYADIFVSIHANASRGKRRDINGLETFYYSGWRGRLLAKKIQKQILKVSPGSPDRGVRQGRYFVIKNTRMPAVLVEIGFLTGRLDARRLEKAIHRKRIAYAITKGILEYLSNSG
ncbi:N-acetylmuramoyl-L-alanine amidase, partial [Prochlorococcus sp. AH-716-K03]|nr:N-acetylmuramoyl-L-alanine amidase [Prochlorococcus sp. AH-716-K03]